MPRTKTIKKHNQHEGDVHVPPVLKSDIAFLMEEKNKAIHAIKASQKNMHCLIKMLVEELMMSIPTKLLDATIEDLKSGLAFQNQSKSIVSHGTTFNSTTFERSAVKPKGKLKRASSFHEDDGYLTAENSNASSDRKSRSRNTTTVPKTTRRTRSLSKSKLQPYKTPANTNKAPLSYGVVTPKVKPNTPQVILRRPKQGEMALSLQGSPLFTGSVPSETMANINIPLNDGRLFTLQPQRGLRMSQVPELDPETKMQLEALRDNLNKLCS